MRREELERGKLLLFLVHALKTTTTKRVYICHYECMTALMLALVFLLFISKE